MTLTRGLHLCSFEAVAWPRGRAQTYANVKAAVLRAGRFSVFEATETQARARLMTRLALDPDLVFTQVGFPWTEVRAKGAR